MSDVVCFFHRGDLDGIGSAAVVLRKIPHAKLIGVDYGRELPKLKEYEKKIVIIVDFSFPNELMFLMQVKAKQFLWFDHHKSAKENLSQLWDLSEGIRDLDRSGVRLVWDYFFEGVEPPAFVKYIEDFDLWRFKYNDDTKNFQEGLKYELYGTPEEQARNEIWEFLFMDDPVILEKVFKTGRILFINKRKHAMFAFDCGKDVIFHGFLTRVMNTNIHMSDTGNFACQQNRFIGLVWFWASGCLNVSLRSIDERIDVSEIAKKYGGGGHKHAAGFKSDFDFIKMLYEVDHHGNENVKGVLL